VMLSHGVLWLAAAAGLRPLLPWWPAFVLPSDAQSELSIVRRCGALRARARGQWSLFGDGRMVAGRRLPLRRRRRPVP
jgi:hypothetical protein